VSDTSKGAGWWVASDGRWYAPELQLDHVARMVTTTAASPARPTSSARSFPPPAPVPELPPTGVPMGRRGRPEAPVDRPATRRPIHRQWWAWAVAAGVLAVSFAVPSFATAKRNASATRDTATTAAGSASVPTVTPAPRAPGPAARRIEGVAVTLGAGSYTGGPDVTPGLYDVSAPTGAVGSFLVEGADSYGEILGGGPAVGVPTVRVRISVGDQISVSGFSTVAFVPVTTPLVTTHETETLGAGTWVVGQDIGPGRYVATPGIGERGTVALDGSGAPGEALSGDGTADGVPSAVVSLSVGEVVAISSLGRVTMTAQ
jgi:hypothetical protein